MDKIKQWVMEWQRSQEMPPELVEYLDVIIRSYTDCEDEYQCCFVKFLKQRDNIKIDKLCTAYFYVVIKSVCADERRRWLLSEVRRKKFLDLTYRED